MSEKKQVFGYILDQFGVLHAEGSPENKVVEIRKCPSGHINKTFFIHVFNRDYVLQALNPNVYISSAAVMHNLEKITALFPEQPGENGSASETEPRIDVPHFLTVNGQNYLELAGECWRMYPYVPEAKDTSKTPYQVGYAYGRYICMLNAGKPELEKTVDGYHDFAAYHNKFMAVTKDNSFETITTFRSKLDAIFTADMPKRYIHGDAKADNLILQADGTCTLLDLDTTMKHFVALDYGDMVRSVTTGIPDTEVLDVIRLVTAGFANGLNGILTSAEIDSLFYGILWVTWELAVRYLTDCYATNRYFVNMTVEQCRERVGQLIGQSEEFSRIKEQIKMIIEAEFVKYTN